MEQKYVKIEDSACFPYHPNDKIISISLDKLSTFTAIILNIIYTSMRQYYLETMNNLESLLQRGG